MSALKRTFGYQTTDGALHTDKVTALGAQLQIDVQGVINRNGLGKIPNITPLGVAQFIAQHGVEIHGLLGKFKEDMRHAQPKKKIN